jgi:hypothetical protein
MPGDERMQMLVVDAFHLWADIPSPLLPTVVQEAIRHSGGFPASNGQVAKAWIEMRDRDLTTRYDGKGRPTCYEIAAKNQAHIVANGGIPSPQFVIDFVKELRQRIGLPA